MTQVHLFIAAATAVFATLTAIHAHARDAARQPVPAGQTSPVAIPNPYAAPAPATGDRGADAYSTGFAIGLGTELINKQREDELKRQQQAQAGRR